MNPSRFSSFAAGRGSAKATAVTAARRPHGGLRARLGLRWMLATALLVVGWAVWSPSAHAQTAPGASVTERREAAAAAADARRGRLDDRGQDYRANALQRCAALPADLRGDCESRVRGEGEASGSVQGGGIFRETTTTILEPAPGAAPAPVTPATPGGGGGPSPDVAPASGVPPSTGPVRPMPPPPAPAVRGSGY